MNIVQPKILPHEYVFILEFEEWRYHGTVEGLLDLNTEAEIVTSSVK